MLVTIYLIFFKIGIRPLLSFLSSSTPENGHIKGVVKNKGYRNVFLAMFG